MNKLRCKNSFKQNKQCHKIEISVIRAGRISEIGEVLVVF